MKHPGDYSEDHEPGRPGVRQTEQSMPYRFGSYVKINVDKYKKIDVDALSGLEFTIRKSHIRALIDNNHKVGKVVGNNSERGGFTAVMIALEDGGTIWAFDHEVQASHKPAGRSKPADARQGSLF